MTKIQEILREAEEEDLQLGDDHDCTKGMSFLRQALREVVEEIESYNKGTEDTRDYSKPPWPKETQHEVNGWNSHVLDIDNYLKNLKEELK